MTDSTIANSTETLVSKLCQNAGIKETNTTKNILSAFISYKDKILDIDELRILTSLSRFDICSWLGQRGHKVKQIEKVEDNKYRLNMNEQTNTLVDSSVQLNATMAKPEENIDRKLLGILTRDIITLQNELAALTVTVEKLSQKVDKLSGDSINSSVNNVNAKNVISKNESWQDKFTRLCDDKRFINSLSNVKNSDIPIAPLIWFGKCVVAFYKDSEYVWFNSNSVELHNIDNITIGGWNERLNALVKHNLLTCKPGSQVPYGVVSKVKMGGKYNWFTFKSKDSIDQLINFVKYYKE